MTACSFITSVALFGIVIHWSDTGQTLQAYSREDQPGFPRVENLLFYLERNPDSNAVCYTLNLNKEGRLIDHDPIKVYWFRQGKEPERKELSYLQKRLAYGVKTEGLGNSEFAIKIVSFPQRTLFLRRWNGRKYQIFTSIAGSEAILSRVYVKFAEVRAAAPRVEYIELYGKTCLSGQEIKERIPINLSTGVRG